MDIEAEDVVNAIVAANEVVHPAHQAYLDLWSQSGVVIDGKIDFVTVAKELNRIMLQKELDTAEEKFRSQ
jgi:hypothetical protein